MSNISHQAEQFL